MENKVVYICSKYSGDIEKNSAAARDYCRMAVDMGYIPIAPHLLFPQFMCEATERDLAISMDLVLLDKCDEIWVCGPELSKGMSIEVEYATKKGMIIKRFENIPA